IKCCSARRHGGAGGKRLRFDIVSAQQHRPDYYADVFAGYRAVRLVDDGGQTRGELVWRLASGQSVEITEFGIYDEADRRRGWGTKLLNAGIADIGAFFKDKSYRLRRIYLFCDAINEPGRRFYEARGFKLATVISGFYHYCD